MKGAWTVSCTGNFTGLHATPGLRVWCGVRTCGDEVKGKCLPVLLPTLFFEAVSLSELGARLFG